MTDTTTAPTTADLDAVAAAVDAYIAMWNEEDPDARAALIAAAWVPEGAYADPLFTAVGPAALSDLVASVHEQYPGRRFRRTSAIDSQHDFHRFAWQLGEGDDLVVAGLDVAHSAPDGRLTGVAGFFGPLPEG